MKIDINIENKENHNLYQKIKYLTRSFFCKRGYQEVELPVLAPALIPESYVEIFKTQYYFLSKKRNLYLTPSPELFMKRLLVYGLGNCFYLGKAFRNSERNSFLHSFEFEILEVYKVGVGYLDFAGEILDYLRFLKKTLRRERLFFLDKYDFNRWEKIKVEEAFKKFAGISKEDFYNHDEFISIAKKKGYQTEGFSYEELWSQIYSQEVEPNLGKKGKPTLIYDYPKEFAALAKLNPDQKTAQRFEIYLDGVELADCYSELTNWQEQKKRFKEEARKRKRLKMVAHSIDWDFIENLKKGLPESSGIAIGIERLAMVLLGLSSIEELRVINLKID